MAEPRQPEDHKPKKSKEADPEEHFTFTQGGEQYTMPVPTMDVITPKFIRQNRRRDELDYALTAFEELAGIGPEAEGLLKAFDRMSVVEFKQFQTDFLNHLGATLGE